MPQAIPAVLAVASIATTAYGTNMQMKAAKQNAGYQQQQIAAEQRAEALRMKAMELDARRKQMEILRQQQRARATGLAASVASGSQYGSGIQGAYGQFSGATGVNMLGVSQNLEIGRGMFAANQDVSAAKMGMAQAGSLSATGRGLSSLGGAMMSAAQPLGNIGQSLFSPSFNPTNVGSAISYNNSPSSYGYRGAWGSAV